MHLNEEEWINDFDFFYKTIFVQNFITCCYKTITLSRKGRPLLPVNLEKMVLFLFL